eukprot:1152493-Pelagomonas_calceolata.AAC.6
MSYVTRAVASQERETAGEEELASLQNISLARVFQLQGHIKAHSELVKKFAAFVILTPSVNHMIVSAWHAGSVQQTIQRRENRKSFSL